MQQTGAVDTDSFGSRLMPQVNETSQTVLVNAHCNSIESQLAHSIFSKAIPLVHVGNEKTNHELKVSDVAASLLSKRTSNKIAVVAIFGDFNSGKSFLLN